MTIEMPSRAAATLPILSHWIGGRAVEVLPEATGPVYDPATGAVVARVPRGGAAEVKFAVATAMSAFPAWRDMPLIARSQIFFAFREQLFRNREELARVITRDHGKTFPDAVAEVMRGLETVEFACGLPVHLAGLNTPNVSTNVDAFTLRGPLGVTAAITPFNFPAMVPMWIYPIALACGNTLVWKPSSHTPGATQLQAELWKEAGLRTACSTSCTAAARPSPHSWSTRTCGRSSLSARRRSGVTCTRPARSWASGSGPTLRPRTR